MTILSRIVKNEAMKTDPPEIYGWRVFMLACSACFGGMLFGWDIGAIGGLLTMPNFKVKYGISSYDDNQATLLSQNIVSTLQAGCLLGCILSYWFSGRYGHKPALLAASSLATIGVIFQASGSGQLAVMYIGRFVSGVGVGAASMLTPLYISENAPRAIRGGLTGLYQLFIASGTMFSFWVNYGCSLNLADKGDIVFVLPLALQMVPAVFLFAGMCLCYESPRWLARNDNWEQAAKVLAITRHLHVDHPYVQMELAEMREQLENERRLIGGATFWDLQKEMWLIKGNRNRALISIGLMTCQQMTGTNAINYYAPIIFQALGVRGTNTGLFATGIYGVVKMVTCACFLLFAADSLGRRRSLLWTSIAQFVAMYIIAIYVLTNYINPKSSNTDISPFGYVSLVCVFLFAGFFQFGWGPCCWIYVSEIPTARLRSMNVAMAAATQWVFNFVVARCFLSMTQNMGYQGNGAYFFFGTCCFLMFFFVWFLVPETKGMSLERMDDLFGVTELVKNIEADETAAATTTTTIHERDAEKTAAPTQTRVEHV